MDTPHHLSASDRRISVDWSLIAITAFAVALLVGSTVRIGAPPAPGATSAGGLAVLGASETLIAFEDFSFGARGWTSTAAPRSEFGNAVYGPFPVGTVSKRYDLPSNVSQVRLSFDLHLTDDAVAENFSVRVNGERLVEGASALDTSNTRVTRQGRSGDYTVRILLDRPGDVLTLEVGASPGPDAAWAIDNVSVVAVGGTS